MEEPIVNHLSSNWGVYSGLIILGVEWLVGRTKKTEANSIVSLIGRGVKWAVRHPRRVRKAIRKAKDIRDEIRR